MAFRHKLIGRWQQLKREMHVTNMPFRFLTMIIFFSVFGKLVEKNILFPKFDERHAQKEQAIFSKKEALLLHYMDIAMQYSDYASHEPYFTHFHQHYVQEMKDQGLDVFIYENDSLTYWSTKDIPINLTFTGSGLHERYISFDKGRYPGRYASFVVSYKGFDIVGLMLIKNVYTYENKYLKTSFQKDFNLPSNLKIFHDESYPNSYPIVDKQGDFVFALIFDNTSQYKYQVYLPALAYFLALLCFFLLLDYALQKQRSLTTKNTYFPFLALILLLVRLTMLYGYLPEVFYLLDIFDPSHFGSSQWSSSLGELMLWCLFIGFFVFELYRNLRFPLFYEHRWKYFVYCGISLITVIVMFFVIGALVQALVINSTNMFEDPNRTILVNRFSILGYLTILVNLVTFCLLLDKTLLLFKQELTFHQFLVAYFFILLLVIVAWSMTQQPINSFSILMLSILVYVIGLIRLKKSIKLTYSHYILFIFLLSIYTAVSINGYSVIKYKDQKKVIVTNLATQHDLTAEFLLKDISDRIISDTTDLVDIAYGNPWNVKNIDILNYIKANYFYASYWNRYLLRCWVCNDTTQLFINTSQRHENCIGYFKNMTDKGTKLARSEFWYIDKLSNGLAYYLGWFRKDKDDAPPVQVFIELWMASTSEELGYPELLLDNRTNATDNLAGYSYAKYYNNNRVTQSGDYKYNLTADIFQNSMKDYHIVTVDGWEHLVYRPDKSNIIVLSTYSPKLLDLLVNFSYVFIFYFILISIVLLLLYLPMIRRTFLWNFKNKIQYTMIAMILISFAIIGIGTIYYINRQSLNKYTENISEKMQAIHRELLDAIVFQKNIDKEWAESSELLTPWLIDLSDRYFTDINLFDVKGRLIATSRPEIFDKGLVGRQINPNAFIPLKFENRASIMQREDIGGLSYISAYEPFLDNENKVIAFLNLPYFTQQDALADEISSVILTIINFYMIIILLTVIVSILMSNQITQPLNMLQEKFRDIKLGEKNEPIIYKSRDEIGGLVKEYNRAIEELARSTNRLARSERESAWREMAKQIAHEINNPLTPMKLSIQHLKRAWDNQSERFGDYMEKISRSLVEQIDNLSSIATEFSNFAKMPAAHNQQIDVITTINNVIPLFATGDNKKSFHTNFHDISQAMICADKEQISRVFINLFKNALQAMPKDHYPQIYVDVLRQKNRIWIRVKDNGMGIPPEMQEKIFRPNFTTKSSGMGVGLSIVRNIIEGAGGTIGFKTKAGKGTAFIINLPASD